MNKSVNIQIIGSKSFAGLKTISISINNKRYEYAPQGLTIEECKNKITKLMKYGHGRALNYLKKRSILIKEEKTQ